MTGLHTHVLRLWRLTHLSEGVDVLGVRSVAIILVYEVVVFLSLSLKRLLTSINVGRQITLHTRTRTGNNYIFEQITGIYGLESVQVVHTHTVDDCPVVNTLSF